MLGRAKWYVYPHSCTDSRLDYNARDAWAKHKDLDSYEAKWLYVEALLKVCSMPRYYAASSSLDNFL